MTSRLVDLLWESVDEEQKLLSSGQAEIVYSNNRNQIVKINSWKALNFYSSILHLLVILPSKDFQQIKQNGDIFLFFSNIDDNIWLPEYILYKTDEPSPLYARYVLYRIIDGRSQRVASQLEFRIFFRSFTDVPEFILKLLLATNQGLIQFIGQPSINLQLTAVQQNGMVIEYIEHPSPLVQFAAIKQNPDVIKFIKPEDLTPSLKSEKSDTLNESNTNNIEQELLSSDQAHIVYEDSDIIMVQIESFAAYQYYSRNRFPVLNNTDWFDRYINYVPLWLIRSKPSDQIWKFWFPVGNRMPKLVDEYKNSVDIAQYLHTFSSINHGRVASGKFDPFLKVFLRYYGKAIGVIREATVSLQLFVVNRNGLDIEYIEHPSPLVQFAAIKQNPDAINFIKSEDLTPSLKNDKPITESTNSSVTESELISSGQAEIVWEKDNRKLIRIESYEAAAYYDTYPHGWYFSKSQSNFNICCGKDIYIFLDSNQQRNCFAFYAESQDLLPRLYRRLDDRITLSTLFIQNRDLPDKALEIFLRDHPWLLYQVENPSIPLQLLVVGIDGTAIDQIKHPSPLVQTAALKQNPKAINNIDPAILDPKLKEKYKEYIT